MNKISQFIESLKERAKLIGLLAGLVTFFSLMGANLAMFHNMGYLVTKASDAKEDAEKAESMALNAIQTAHKAMLKASEAQSSCDLQQSAIANQRKDLNTVMRLISDGNKR